MKRTQRFSLLFTVLLCSVVCGLGCKESKVTETTQQRLWREGWEKKLQNWDKKVAKWQKALKTINKDIAKVEKNYKVWSLKEKKAKQQAKKHARAHEKHVHARKRSAVTKKVVQRRPVPKRPTSRPTTQPKKPTTQPSSVRPKPIYQESFAPAARRTVPAKGKKSLSHAAKMRQLIQMLRRKQMLHRKKTKKLGHTLLHKHFIRKTKSIAELQRIRLKDLRKRAKQIKHFLKWFSLGKVEKGRLLRLKYGLSRRSIVSKAKKKKAGVWELANQARYGRLQDYDWSKGDSYFTAYYLRKFLVLVVEFNKKNQLVDAKIGPCARPGTASLSELHSIMGHHAKLVDLIHATPVLKGAQFNPTQLLRSANALRSFGKKRIVAAMKFYLELVHRYRICRYRYNLDERKILPLLRLLFVRKKGAGAWPTWDQGQPNVRIGKSKYFPLFPLVLEKGLPFFLAGEYTRLAKPLGPIVKHVEDAAKHGELRKKNWAPKSSPIDAVKSLVASKAWNDLISSDNQKESKAGKVVRTIDAKAFASYHKSLLYKQATHALSALLSQKAVAKKTKSGKKQTSVVQQLSALRAVWDAQAQQWKKGSNQ